VMGNELAPWKVVFPITHYSSLITHRPITRKCASP
jgi:hypothetical protein